jgi:hypothetical protein
MRRYFTLAMLGMLVVAGAAMAADASARLNRLAGDTLQQFTPAKHYVWTDKLAYTQGETIKLMWTAAPMGDPYPYTVFIKMVNLETGGRNWVANNALSTELRDAFGNPQGNYAPTVLPEVTGQVMLTTAAAATGYCHFVAELRDVNGVQVIKRSYAKFAVVSGEVTLGGDGADTEISSDTTWTRDTLYHVRHQVFVNPGATLTIEPGTVILASGQNSVIVVEQGGMMVADGRKEMPIVMSCDAPVGDRFSGCWAGLIVLGKATVNIQGGTGLAEGVIPATRPAYGGNDDEDDSGIYRFVRVEFAGVDVTQEIQPNAFGFHGVGRGTVVDYIQAHDGEDDGIEFFGGTANAKHLVIDGSKDDGLDWAFGWRGKVQFVYVAQDGIEAERGIEADNNEFGVDNEPRSRPEIWNITMVGSTVGGRGIMLRRGASVSFKNYVVQDFPNDCLEVRDDETFAQITAGNSLFQFGTCWNNAGKTGIDQIDSAAQPWVLSQPNNFFADPMLRNVRYEKDPDPRPKDNSAVCAAGKLAQPPSDGFLSTGGACAGAFGHQENWLEEWTFLGQEADFAPAF